MEATCGGSSMSDFECLRCEHHKNRAARWRAEAYKQAGHDKIELPWVGLTYEEIQIVASKKWWDWEDAFDIEGFSRAIERVLKEKNT